MTSTLAEVLEALSFPHLTDVLSSTTFQALSELSRTALLTKLKELGVSKLPERQKLATGISKVLALDCPLSADL